MMKKFLENLNGSDAAKKGLKLVALMKLVGFVGQLVVMIAVICMVTSYANNSREMNRSKIDAYAASIGRSAESSSESVNQLTEKEYDKLYNLTNEIDDIPSEHRETLKSHGMVYVSSSTTFDGQLVYGASDGQWYWLLYEGNNFAPVGEPACSLEEFLGMLMD